MLHSFQALFASCRSKFAPSCSKEMIDFSCFSATSDELSAEEFFLRISPPDRFQVDAMLDILEFYGWNYFAIIHDEVFEMQALLARIILKLPRSMVIFHYLSFRDCMAKMVQSTWKRGQKTEACVWPHRT